MTIPGESGGPDSSSSGSERNKRQQPQQAEDETQLSMLEKGSLFVHGSMESAFGKLATVVVNSPLITIFSALLLAIALFQGIHVYEEELSADKQFTPRGTRAVDEQEWLELPENYGWADRTVEVYFTGPNMVSQEGLEYMHGYWNNAVKGVQGTAKGKVVTYDTQCAPYRTSPGCKEPLSVLSLFGYNETAVSTIDPSKISSTEWRKLYPTGSDVDYYLSGVQVDANGVIVHADAARLVFELRHVEQSTSDGDDDPFSREYEIQLAEHTEDFYRTGAIQAFALTDGQDSKQSGDAVSGDVTSLIAGYMLTVVYTCFVLSRPRAKFSHGVLGLASVLSVGMATMSSYGLCWLIGIKFNNVVQVLVLILLGVGVDDTFVIMDCWWECYKIPDMKERMITALSRAGPAITVTSLTDMIAFLAGSSTEFPALRDFCYYATFGILFDFAYQVTFFVAIAYFSSKRQDAGLADFCCCVKVEDDSGCGCCIDKEVAHNEGDRGKLANLSGRVLPRLTIASITGRIIVVVITAALLGVSIWGITELEMDFDTEWFVPKGASLRDVFDVRDTYFQRNNVYANVYLGNWDYPSLAVQNRMGDIGSTLESNKWVVSGSFMSWMVDFKDWVRRERPANYNVQTTEVIPRESFYALLREFTDINRDYQNDVLYAEDGSVRTSRVSFLITGAASDDGTDAVDAMDTIRDSMDAMRGEGETLFAWAFPFVFWTSYKLYIPEVTRNVLIAGACVLVLVTVLVASIPMGLTVLLCVGLVDICMLGFMRVVGVAVNSVSVICIVVAIGLAVDYSVHISHAFLLVKASDTDEHSSRQLRAGFALSRMGPAVLNGAFSTFLAVLPLAFAKSYVFIVFFRMFAVIIFFGVWFGVIVLPLFLSVTGPAAYTNAKHIDEFPEHNPLGNPEPEGEPPANSTTEMEVQAANTGDV